MGLNIKHAIANGGQKALWLAAALLLLVLLWQAVQLWTRLQAVPPEATHVSKIPTPEYQLSVLTDKPLFANAPVRQQAQTAPVQANQNFQLQGLFASDNQSLASAIISGSGIDTQNYKVGDELDDGIELVEIASQHVIIRNNGERQTIELPVNNNPCLLYTSPSPRDATLSRMPSSA